MVVRRQREEVLAATGRMSGPLWRDRKSGWIDMHMYPLVIEHSHGIDGPNRNRWFTYS